MSQFQRDEVGFYCVEKEAIFLHCQISDKLSSWIGPSAKTKFKTISIYRCMGVIAVGFCVTTLETR